MTVLEIWMLKKREAPSTFLSEIILFSQRCSQGDLQKSRSREDLIPDLGILAGFLHQTRAFFETSVGLFALVQFLYFRST